MFEIDNIYDYIEQVDNVQLTALLREVRLIGKSNSPAAEPKSKELKKLFTLSSNVDNFWLSKYNEIRRKIENEILNRIEQHNYALSLV